MDVLTIVRVVGVVCTGLLAGIFLGIAQARTMPLRRSAYRASCSFSKWCTCISSGSCRPWS
jgi:MFS superfamily sulfate permease-like transporter